MAGRCISAQASVSTQRCNRHINKYPLEWPCRNDSGWMSIFRNRAGLFLSKQTGSLANYNRPSSRRHTYLHT